MQIVFPCPNCGANQSVDDSATSVQCQFCGTTITVPENLRPKPAQPQPPAAATQTFSFSGTTSIPGMAGMPGMFLNMDIGKLREMALAARAGNQAEAARLYQETFGVSPEEAQQAAELMSSHHHIMLSQMQMSTPLVDKPLVFQMGSVPAGAPPVMSSGTYNLPSPPIIGSGQPTGRRWGACLAVALVLLIAVVFAGAIVASALLRAR
jgi:hypothetical protein